jgi:C4-dicarboxylate transporter, DctQ subunit
MNRLKSILDKIVVGCAFLSGIILALLTLLISIDVIMRYVFNNPVENVSEATEHALLFITFLGAAWVQKKGKHVSIDLLQIHLQGRMKITVDIVTSLLGAITCILLTWFGLQATLLAFQRGTVFATNWGLPRWPILSVIPFGSFLLFLQFTVQSILQMGALKAKKENGIIKEVGR